MAFETKPPADVSAREYWDCIRPRWRDEFSVAALLLALVSFVLVPVAATREGSETASSFIAILGGALVTAAVIRAGWLCWRDLALDFSDYVAAHEAKLVKIDSVVSVTAGHTRAGIPVPQDAHSPATLTIAINLTITNPANDLRRVELTTVSVAHNTSLLGDNVVRVRVDGRPASPNNVGVLDVPGRDIKSVRLSLDVSTTQPTEKGFAEQLSELVHLRCAVSIKYRVASIDHAPVHEVLEIPCERAFRTFVARLRAEWSTVDVHRQYIHSADSHARPGTEWPAVPAKE